MFDQSNCAEELTEITPMTTIERAAALLESYGDLSGEALLRPMIKHEFRGRIALVSSFGTESAVLLHLAAAIDRDIPVLFVNTGKLFGETLRYGETLIAKLGLTNVRTVSPDGTLVGRLDHDGMLWHRDTEACCELRKVSPLAQALSGFDAWISGRKRFQGASRAHLPLIESLDGKVKINPLADWTVEQMDAVFAAHDLPRHPLEAEGFLSVGCYTCTARVAPGGDRRSGRWPGSEKTECGIHVALPRAS